MPTGFITFFHSPILLSSVNFQVNSFNSFQSQKLVHSFLLTLTSCCNSRILQYPLPEKRVILPLLTGLEANDSQPEKGGEFWDWSLYTQSSETQSAEEEWLLDLYIWSVYHHFLSILYMLSVLFHDFVLLLFILKTVFYIIDIPYFIDQVCVLKIVSSLFNSWRGTNIFYLTSGSFLV